MEKKLLVLNILLFRLENFLCSNITQVESLYKTLFENYNRELFPLQDHNDTVNISCTVGIVSINNFDELSGEMELTMMFFMQWIDERLTWTPSNYGGKSTLLIPPEKLWLPQLYVVESFEKMQEISNVSVLLRLYSDGRISWNPGNVLKIICSVDVTYFPFDTQTCGVTVAGWVYTKDEMLIYTTDSMVGQDFLSRNSQWTIQSATVANISSIVATPPPGILIQLILKRRSTFFVVYIIFPMIFLGLINNLVCVMPASSGERTSVAITTFLSFIVFMEMINSSVPKSSFPMAYIYYYILFLLVYSSVIIFLCIMSLRIHDKENPVPPTIERAVFFLRFRWLKRRKKSIVEPQRKSSTGSEQFEIRKKGDDFEEEDRKAAVTWKIVGKTFDMYCYCALFVAFFVMTTQTFVNLDNNHGF